MAKPNAVMPPLSLELGWPSYQQSTVDRWQGSGHLRQPDYIAEEAPVALIYNGAPHVVMLATPADLEDFAIGFSITEGIVGDSSEIVSIRTHNRANGIEVYIQIPPHRFACLPEKNRNLAGRTGCGLCGSSTLLQAVRAPRPIGTGITLAARDLTAALDGIHQHQAINRLTGAVHAAAWALPGPGVQALREDVGRHNALDKLIGLLTRTRKDAPAGFVVMTSRASYELVQKAACIGISLLAAMSAPTGLAIRMAEEAGMTLIGFARGDRYVVYSHPQRLTHSAPLLSLTNN